MVNLKPKNDQDRVYPCADCGTLRSKDEGGTVFTVCEKCWDKEPAISQIEKPQKVNLINTPNTVFSRSAARFIMKPERK